MSSKARTLIALLIPFLALAALTGLKHYRVTSGTQYTLPIVGFDPRDLLSGHYLIYRINYGMTGVCKSYKKFYSSRSREAVICLKPRFFNYGSSPNRSCQHHIKGLCKRRRFEAGIEKYYIPQEHAIKLDKVVRDKKGSVIISVTGSGKASLVDLLIENQSWKDFISK